MFQTQDYIRRRQELKKRLHGGILLFLGNDDSPMNYADNAFPFRQDSSFLYYFGLDFSGLAAIIDLDEDREIIFGNELTLDDIVWMGNQPSLKERGLAVGIGSTQPAGQLGTTLARALSQGRIVHHLPPYRAEHKLKLMELLNYHPSEQNSKASVEFIRAVVAQRSVKSLEEIREIEQAVDISVRMHETAMSMARAGMKELDLAAEVQRIAVAAGGQLAFPVICTVNGQTLHNHYYGNTLKSGDMVLLDTGAETNLHYGGDLSSTFPVDPFFSPGQKELYEIQLRAHNAAIAGLKPDVPFIDIHHLACTTMAQGLKEIGLMKGDIEEAVQQGAHAMFFPCGTGHMMGLDIHDMENLGEHYVGYDEQPRSRQFGLKSLRLARPLSPGFVVTIEPGIYFIPELIDIWKGEGRFTEFINYDILEKYRHFGGIRNEENFLITSNGHRRLGNAKPISVHEVEAMRRV